MGAGSFYSRTKAYVEDMLKSYNHVLTLRVRPIFRQAVVRYFRDVIVGLQGVVCEPLLLMRCEVDASISSSKFVPHVDACCLPFGVVAGAHAHLGRPQPPQLRHQDRQLRQGAAHTTCTLHPDASCMTVHLLTLTSDSPRSSQALVTPNAYDQPTKLPVSVTVQVVDVPNSMTVLTDLLPISLIMAERKLTGIYNFVNPGAISHNQVRPPLSSLYNIGSARRGRQGED